MLWNNCRLLITGRMSSVFWYCLSFFLLYIYIVVYFSCCIFILLYIFPVVCHLTNCLIWSCRILCLTNCLTWSCCILCLTNCLIWSRLFFRTAEFLFRHLAFMASQDSITSMHCKNLAIVWAPNLLRLIWFETWNVVILWPSHCLIYLYL